MKKGDEDAGYRGRGNPDTRLRYALWQKDGAACSADITYSRWHGMSGIPLEVLMQLGGWSELRMVMRYAHRVSGHGARYADSFRAVDNSGNGHVSAKAEKQTNRKML